MDHWKFKTLIVVAILAVIFSMTALALALHIRSGNVNQALHDQKVVNYKLCISGQISRRIIRGILIRAEALTAANGRDTTFYEEELARIKSLRCPPNPDAPSP